MEFCLPLNGKHDLALLLPNLFLNSYLILSQYKSCSRARVYGIVKRIFVGFLFIVYAFIVYVSFRPMCVLCAAPVA